MELIASFQVDHTRLVPGIYVSRTDVLGAETATTFDLRMKKPNTEKAITPAAMHSIEHVVATFLRNDPGWKDRIIYFGPMGCLTGCYLILKGSPTPQEILPLILNAFRHAAAFEGEVPGATPVNCGNAALHDPAGAREEAAAYVKILEENPVFDYPVAERIKTADGAVFHDS